MLYREPKLLKVNPLSSAVNTFPDVSVLYREPKLLKAVLEYRVRPGARVSVLYREPKLLKDDQHLAD